MQRVLDAAIRYSILGIVFLGPVFFLPVDAGMFELRKLSLWFSLALFGVVAWLAKMIFVEREIKIVRTPLDIPIALFLASLLLSALFSVERWTSLFGTYGLFYDGLIGIGAGLLTYILFSNNVRSEETTVSVGTPSVESVVKTFFLSFALALTVLYLSVFGVFKQIASLSFFPRGIFPAFGYQSAEAMAIALAIGTALLIAAKISFSDERFFPKFKKLFSPLSFPARFPVRNKSALVRIKKMLVLYARTLLKFSGGALKFVWNFLANAWIALPAVFFLLIVFNVASAWLALIVALIFLAAISMWKGIVRERAIPLRPLFLPLGTIIAALFFLMFPLRVQLPFQFPRESLLSQNATWNIAWNSATDNAGSFVFGSGIGTFQADVSAHRLAPGNSFALWPRTIQYAGNAVAELLATSGFLGMALYAGFLLLFFYVAFFFLFKDSVKFLLSKKKRDPDDSADHSRAGVHEKSAWLFFVEAGTMCVIGAQFFYHQNTGLLLFFWMFLALFGVCAVAELGGRRKKTALFWSRARLANAREQYVRAAVAFGIVLTLSAVALLFEFRLVVADQAYAQSLATPFALLDAKIREAEHASSLNPFQAEYKIYLTRLYLDQIGQELQKPSAQQDKILLAKGVQKALAYGRGGEIDGAVVSGGVELAPARADAWETLGNAYGLISFVNGATEWGVRSFENAIRLAPTEPAPYTALGKLYMANNNFSKARALLDKALLLKFDFKDAIFESALLDEKEGTPAGGIKRLEDLRLDYPADSAILFELGRMYYNDNRLADAAKTLRQAVALDSGNSNIHYALGVALAKSGQKNAALNEFQKVLELNPGNEDVLQRLKELQ